MMDLGRTLHGVGSACIPDPTLEGLQRRDPIRGELAVAALPAAPADPSTELEVIVIETLDMALGDAGVTFTINKDPEGGQPVLKVRLAWIPDPTVDGL